MNEATISKSLSEPAHYIGVPVYILGVAIFVGWFFSIPLQNPIFGVGLAIATYIIFLLGYKVDQWFVHVVYRHITQYGFYNA